MNNRRNLKENLTISNKQRFSIRKFSIGVASVMLGTTLYFMGGVGTSIVHADSVQGQSVQTSNLDTNSAQASSDTSSAEQTSSQNQTSSAQNSQKAVSNASSNTESTDSKTQTSDQVDNATTDKNEASQADNATTDKNEASQADNASATNIKTRDNKKVVSDANRAKSTANDTQTKPAQQTAKSDAANSNTLVVQRTKKLTVNAKLLTDNKAQTDTQTNSKYSVTDNYPEGLMNYLPGNFHNDQEYAFEWLRNENNNNIILTTNRTGDGVVYVYQDGKRVCTLAQNSSHTLHDTIVDIFGHYHQIDIGKVYNDTFAGIVHSEDYPLNIIYSSHAKDVDATAGSSYSTVDFFVPRKIKQTVTYYDSKGNVIDSLTHTQYGLTGQSYTTGLPHVVTDQYLVNTTHNGNGLMSEFNDGYECTENYHDGVTVTFKENDHEGTGTMDYVIYDGDEAVQSGSLAYGQSADYTNYSGRYTIVNPYVPQTTNIVYQYKELGNVVNIDPKGKTTKTQYKNDPNDPTKVKSINVPSIPGYTTLVNGKTVMPADPGKDTTITIMPADPGLDTYITYSANAQSTTAKFVDDDNKGAQVGDTVPLNGKTDQTINTGLEVPVHYELAKDQTIPATYTFKANGNEPIVIHLVHAKKADQNDNNLNKIVTRTINVTNPDGKTNTIKQVAHLRRSGTIDEVTQKATYTPWTTDNWAEYDTPRISGYTPSQAKVSATTVDGNTQDQTVTITYSANAQSTTAKFVDDDNKGAQVGDTVPLNGKTDQTINTGLEVPVHYELAKDQTIPATYTFKANGNEPIVIHLVHAKKADQNDNNLNKIVTRTINVTNPDGKTNTIKQVAHLRRSGTIDEVTQKATYTPWTTDNWAEYDTPRISGYTPSQAKVSATTVDGNTQDQTVTITYSANAQSTTAKFVDDDNKGAQVGDTVPLNGKTDQTINTGLEVPVHYELAKDQTIPATYTFKANGNEPIVIHLVHAKKADQNDNNLNKIVTRTINVTNPDGKTNTIKQVAHLRRSGTIDEVTQKATYTPWTTDNWAEYDTPRISGYTPSQAKVSATTVDGNTQDQTVTITYSANAQSTTAKFVDDDNKGAQVGDTVPLNGKTDQTINTGLEVPVHYELAKDQTIPATYTFKANGNEPIVIHLVHAKKADQNDNNLNKIVTRTINVTNPDGKTNTIKQVAHLRRSGTIDEVTQKATYTPWTTDNWAEYDTPRISGYTPSQAKVSATTVDGNTQDQTVTITYSANAQSTTAKFVDDDNKGAQVGDTVPLNGKTDQTINTGLEVPVHYELAKDQTIPATYTFKANGNEPIVIHLVHAKKADQNDNNLNKIVTRTINVTNPDGKTNTIKQVAHLRRSGTIDEVTQKATYTPWTTDNWAEYDTPRISGYTPSQAKVSATTVDGNTQDQTVTITYSANAQSTTAKFVDDDNKGAQVGDTVPLNGKTDQTINTGLEVPVHYELAKDQTIPATYTFKANGNEPIVIHLVHAKKADQNDNNLNKIVTRTINVTNPDGKTNTIKQVAHLRRSGTIDEVTQKATYTPWTTDNWAEYDTPRISGYTPSQAKVSATTVDGNTQDQTVTITYSANAQSTTAKFVDDDNKGAQVGDTVPLNGKTDQTINTGLEVPVHYELAKDQTIPATYTFKANGNEPIVIHLVHAKKADQNDNNLNKIVTRTINVTNPDGKTNTIKQVAHLRRSGTIDEVTQKATYTPWTTDNWAEYDTPRISGYTPSQAKVSATTVDGNTQDQTVTITYSANAQSTTAKFVDDDNKGAQVGDTVPLNGKTDQTINTGLEVPVHYELAKDQTIPATYTFKANGNEPIVIHLVHAKKADQNDNNLNKIVTRTINVTNPDGKTNTIKQVAHLRRSGTIDEVTQKATYTPWTTDNWAEYDTPRISGYTPSQAKVSATTVDGNTQDQTVTITYSANAQSTTAKFVDDDNKGAQVGDTVPLNGKTDQTINTGLEVPVHYELAKDQTIPATYTFKANGNEPIVIHLVHAKKADQNDNNLNKIVTRTINVTNPDGKTNTIKQVAHLRRSGTIDEVTQKATYTPWTTDNWAEYDTPRISGYTPSQAKVSATTVDGNTQDQTVTITYSADAQKATINYIDDTTGKTINSETVNGHTGEAIADPTEAIANYEKQGYKLVSDDLANGASFDNDDKIDQAFYIHLNHNTETITPDKPKTPSDIIPGTGKHYPSGVDKDDLNKTVTRTINVISPDGKTTTIKQPVTLQRSATVDDVTGQITYKAWNTGKWEEYDTPQISGYTPSQAKVSATTVDGNTQDLTVTITYSANDQKATINYIDDTTGKTINSETINGHTGEAIADPTEAIANYEKQGYKLVSDDLANGASFDNDDKIDQAFYIHLNHDTETITPDHPKVPGTPINPSGDAKYPDGVDKESLTKTITRTINYVDNKGNKVNGSPDGKSTYVQTVTFTRTVTIDKVTGDIKSSTPWVPANGTWSQVNSRDPHELGYDSVDTSTVGSKVVTSSSKDETITVTYSKDGGALTPTPEPNPDPNPQPQPSDPRNVPVPSTPTSHPTQPTNNKKDDENKDNNSNPKKRRNPNKPTVKTGSTRNNHPKINNNTSAKVANGKTSKAAKTLPQTGENNKFGLIGLLFAALGVVFGLAGDRKRKN